MKIYNFVVKKYELGFTVQIIDFGEAVSFENRIGETSVDIRGNICHMSPEFRYAYYKD